MNSSLNLTLRQLRAFVLVTDCGKFTLAAQRMHITQSALSTLIKELETSVGVRLLDRHTRMVELTEAGRSFYAVAEKTLSELSEAVGDLKELAALRTGRVRVVASTVICASLLSGAIKEFKAIHPDTLFVLQDVAEEQILQTVLSGSVDFGIGSSMELEDGVDEQHLFDDRFIALCSKDHPLARKRKMPWRDLEGEPFIALARESPIAKLIGRTIDACGLRLNVVNEVSFATTVLSLVSAGVGVSVLPRNNHPYVDAFQVHAAELVNPVIHRKISIFTKRHRSLPPSASAFVEFLHAYIARTEGGPQRTRGRARDERQA